LYSMHAMLGAEIPPAMLGTLREQIKTLAEQDLGSLKAQVRSQSSLFRGMDGEIQKSIEAMDDIPPIVLVPLLDSYMKGALVALPAYEHGGWAGVDALYRDPPTSTEQVLHPETKLFPVRERPHRVALPKSGDPQLAGNVLGELQWRVYFDLWKSPPAPPGAQGGGRGRFSVAPRRRGGPLGRRAPPPGTPPAPPRVPAAHP